MRPPLTSEAHALWLDDVLAGLGLDRVSMAGVSFGGWLAIDYATRRPGRVESLVLLAPGGVGRHRNLLLWAAPLLLLGPWGRKLVRARLGGPALANPSPKAQAFGAFLALIGRHFRYRTARLPKFSDARLQSLTMPVLAVLGAKDAFIDSAVTRARLERHAPRAEVRWLEAAGHFLPPQTAEIEAFLQRALRR